jgi:cellulose synthase/poly-beta-1,6-N-acetylglucosamine synthase-like glycosyltransferase
MILLAVAAAAFGLLALAWGAYPLLMRWRARRSRARPHGPFSELRRQVAVVVATRDDPSFAVARVRNLRASEYPPRLLRIVVAVDSAAPYPVDAYQAALGGLADVVIGDPPGGKAAALNAGVRLASEQADVLVFADVGQEFNRDAITQLVVALQDATTGAVTGRYTHGREDGLMSAYADFEALIRAGQAAGGSVVSASGSILAMKPAFWRDLPAGLICDDLFIGLSVVRQGSRVAFCPEAIAFDPRVFTRDQQITRRVRTLTGLIQYCLLVPGVLVPWRNPVWAHFVLHKVLRLLTPFLFGIGALAVGAWLALAAPLVVFMSLVVTLVAAGLLRWVAPSRFERLRQQASWSVRLMLVPVVAIANGLRGRWSVWTPTSQTRTELRQKDA